MAHLDVHQRSGALARMHQCAQARLTTRVLRIGRSEGTRCMHSLPIHPHSTHKHAHCAHIRTCGALKQRTDLYALPSRWFTAVCFAALRPTHPDAASAAAAAAWKCRCSLDESPAPCSSTLYTCAIIQSHQKPALHASTRSRTRDLKRSITKTSPRAHLHASPAA